MLFCLNPKVSTAVTEKEINPDWEIAPVSLVSRVKLPFKRYPKGSS
jgi:hypothetical protein